MYGMQVTSFKFNLFNSFLKNLMSSRHEERNLKAHGRIEDCFCAKI